MSDESTTAAGPANPNGGRPEAYTEPAGEGPPTSGLIRVEAEEGRKAAEVSAELTRSQANEHAKALTGQVGAMTEQGVIRTEADQHAHDSDVSGQQTRNEAEAGRKVAEESAEKTRGQANEHQEITMISLARVASTAEALTTQVGLLTSSYAADKEEARTARSRYLTTLSLALLTLVVVVVVGAGYIRGQSARATINTRELQLIQQQQSTQVEQRKEVIATQQRLISCTDPAGTCKKQSDAELAKTIANLNAVAVARIACSDNYPGLPDTQQIAAINRCITRNLAEGVK